MCVCTEVGGFVRSTVLGRWTSIAMRDGRLMMGLSFRSVSLWRLEGGWIEGEGEEEGEEEGEGEGEEFRIYICWKDTVCCMQLIFVSNPPAPPGQLLPDRGEERRGE